MTLYAYETWSVERACIYRPDDTGRLEAIKGLPGDNRVLDSPPVDVETKDFCTGMGSGFAKQGYLP